MLALGSLGCEVRERGINELGDLHSPLYAIPRYINPVHQIAGSWLAREQHEGLQVGPAGFLIGKAAHHLSFVHPAAAIRERAECFAGDGIFSRKVELERGTLESAGATIPAKNIPDHAFWLPWRESFGELLRVRRGIAGDLESLDRQNCRRGVMSVTTASRRYGKTGDNDVGAKFANDPNDVGEDLFPVPELQCLFRGFGKAEVDGAGEKLAAFIQPAGREEFLRSGDAEAFVEVCPELVLPAITSS